MAEDAVRALLRSTEHLKAVLDTVVIESSGEDRTSSNVQEEGVNDARVLAVVAHKEDQRMPGDPEEGSLFVCKFRAKEDGATRELDIERVFPMAEGFSVSMAQTRRGTAVSGAQPKQQTGFILTINPGMIVDSENESDYELVAFFTSDVQKLRLLLKQCRELSDSFDDQEGIAATEAVGRFSWVLPYTSRRLPPHFGLIPQDLRLDNTPFHERLSPAVAGLPGDDIADIKLIREEWVLAKTREISHKARRRLKIRLGTFNVNGQLPSQDLSGWIRTQFFDSDKPDLTIPPLPKVSPISLGEMATNPFDTPWSSTVSAPDEPTEPAVTNPTGPIVGFVEGSEYVDVSPDPDMIVLGFQELDLSTEALLYSTGTVREDAWCLAVFAALGEKIGLYEKLISRQLVGMLIVVLVKKTLVPCFTDVQTSSAGAGIMGIMGNKGGTAVRVAFTPLTSSSSDGHTSSGSTILTFVNAHLAAFDEMFERRNSDFLELSRKLKFDLEFSQSAAGSFPLTVYESDVLFWMGGKRLTPSHACTLASHSKPDLNYRIDLSDADVRGTLGSEKWDGRFEALAKYDQLRKAARIGKAFVGFCEHPMAHLPTYRFSPGILIDELGYDVKRKPAWTDRILYMANPSMGLRQLSYTSHPHITMSDHRPVAADFVVDAAVYDKEFFVATLMKLYRTVDRMDDMGERAILKLDATSFEMGTISYRRSTSQTIQLRNIGKGPCAFRFVPVAADSSLHPEWLRVEPKQGIVFPNEAVNVTLTAFVDNKSASRLNLSEQDLNEMLILHTMSGKDHFITITGKYQYTSFANQLSRLTRLSGPIRSLTSPDDLRPEETAINAPREIMRLVNWMMTEYTSVEGLFVSPIDEGVVDTIRECLDTGEDFPFSPNDITPQVILAFAETLRRFLDSLVDPVVPPSLHVKCGQIASRDEAFELLDAFPPVSVNVWISLTAFLHFICQSSTTNETLHKAESIATIFAPILLRDDPDSSFPAPSLLGRRQFLLYFIT